MSNPINKLVILGGGITGWTVAHQLRISLPATTDIFLIESALPDTEKQCCCLTPAAASFFKDQGIEENTLMSQKSSYRLATAYRSHQPAYDYFLSFSPVGFSLNGIGFHHYAAWSYHNGDTASYDDYSLSAVAGRAGRFRHPSAVDKSLFSTITYGYQINNAPLADYLKSRSLAMGVNLIEADFCSAKLDQLNNITALIVSKSESQFDVDGSFFIDCSGNDACLLSGSLGDPYVSELNSLPVNYELNIVIENNASLKSANSVVATSFGWLFEIETATKRQISAVFNEEFNSVSEVSSYLINRFAVSPEQIRSRKLNLGRRTRFWKSNCVAIGAAAGDIQEFGFGELALVQSATLRLVDLYPATDDFSEIAREFNRLTHLEYDHIRDFHALHYRLFRQDNSPFWLHASSNQLSKELCYRMDLFKATGRMPFYEGDPYVGDIWISLLLGAKYWPDSFDILVNNADPQWIKQQLEKMRNTISRAAQTIPELKQYLSVA